MGFLPPPVPDGPDHLLPMPGRRTTGFLANPALPPPANPPFIPPRSRPKGPPGDDLGYRTGVSMNPANAEYKRFLDSVGADQRRKKPGGILGEQVRGQGAGIGQRIASVPNA